MNFSVRTTGREVNKHVAISVEETILVINESACRAGLGLEGT
jgi:hypothetical protein